MENFTGIVLPRNNEWAIELLKRINAIISDNRAFAPSTPYANYRIHKTTKLAWVMASTKTPHELEAFLNEEPNLHELINWANA